MKAKNLTILGLQWGDEGKGKVVDYFSRQADIVVRFGGGANAGHTVVTDKGKFILHLLPTGILHPQIRCLIGGGVVCDPAGLAEELDSLTRQGINHRGRLIIDYSTHLVLPHHQAWDKYCESLDSDGAIATTLRGIGPAYADKAERIGIIAADLLDDNRLRQRIANFLSRKKAQIAAMGESRLATSDYLYDYLKAFSTRFGEMIGDVTAELKDALLQDRNILFEGAQGALLDIGLGTYPYVTSSSTTIGGLFSGLGVPPGSQGEVLGIVKAYATRVGNGPFPTELADDIGEKLRQKGGEFGATTGRPRRTGWLDLAVVRRTAFMAGVDGLILTKLDVLDGLERIKVGVAHKVYESVYDFPPLHSGFMEKASPEYREFPGWSESTSGLKKFSALPENARKYVSFIEKAVGKPVKYISTGPHTDSIIKKT